LTDQQTSTVSGVAFGLAAVMAWAVYNVGVAQGRAAGFTVGDLTFLRYLALAPVALQRMRRQIFGPSPIRILALLCLAGPHFGVLYNLGMPLTRLSHAVIISPGLSMISALALTALSLRRVPVPSKLIGIAVLLTTLVMIALDRPSIGPGPAQQWRGDLIFVLTGALYGTFSFLLGRWRGDAVVTTFWISALSLLVVGPWYAFNAAPSDHQASAWVLQFVLQGVLGGGWAIVLYAISIKHLGADRAGIFPALVPVCAALVNIPISGSLPSALEGIGCILAALGMYLTLKNPKRVA
jgi:drug/metabolite transporter (DMT)-like permease